jgi:CRISPR-associated protein Csm2
MATGSFHSSPRRGDDRPPRDAGPTIDVSDVRFGDPLDPRLFADIAEAKARAVSQGAGRDANKSSQLRRFYDELAMWHEKVGSSPERFTELQPYIFMLKAKVAYAKGRNHLDANFETLFRHVIDQCGSAATLRHAKLFMEAFMAFYKVFQPK